MCDGAHQNKTGFSLLFNCGNGYFIPFSLLENNISDCWNGVDESMTSLPSPGYATIDRLTELNKLCIFDRKENTTFYLYYCMLYECPLHFKCSISYCIHHMHVCDGIIDCPDGEDEHNKLCTDHICHHMFKCVYGSHCLDITQLCDGIKHCNDETISGEDESLCEAKQCAPGCNCQG